MAILIKTVGFVEAYTPRLWSRGGVITRGLRDGISSYNLFFKKHDAAQ